MTGLLIGEAPLLVFDATQFARIIDDGIVESIIFLYATLAEAVAVGQLQLYGMCTSLGVFITDFLQGGILCAVENPYGIRTCLWRITGYHLVRLLIDADLEVDTVYGGNAVGICSLETVGRAGGEKAHPKPSQREGH